jgi:hypothetical protein
MIYMVVYDRFKHFGKVVENRYGSIVLDRRSFRFFKNRDDDSMFPQFGENILGQTEIKNKLENRYKDFGAIIIIIIMSRVRGFVTNDNGFWI